MKSETITTFVEQNAGWTTEVQSSYDSTMDISTSGQADIANFLARPVKLSSDTWPVASSIFYQFNPWRDWITSPRVREKLAHYELLRCKLHLKFIISGTGFHYGRAMVSYNPWSGFDGVSVTRAFLDVDLVQASQKPKIFLDPATNMGGEMILPFFFHKNYMSLSTQDYGDMGRITVKAINPLLHANGGDDPVTITVFAWAEDVALTMPTSQYEAQAGRTDTGTRSRFINNGFGFHTNSVSQLYAPQSGTKSARSASNVFNRGDEYGRGIVSSPASAIAHAAGHLVDAPVIGKYARATQLCAQATGDVASLFGYSRPPVITDPLLIKPHITGNLVNTDASEAVTKLSLDSKQELTVDSRTTGLAGDDQMTIASLVSRESYLTQFTMNPSKVADNLLWNCRVGPMLYRVNNKEIHPTPMAMVSNMFGRWQGTIKYRFQIVKSAHHKGKLLVRWDPRSHEGVEYNTAYSRVIDLAEEDDFEISIGWGQAHPFSTVTPMVDTAPLAWSDTTRLSADFSDRWNGILEVNVVNPLVSPSIDSSIYINVYVSAHEDLKLGNPDGSHFNNLSIWPDKVVPQSGYVPQSGVTEFSNEIIPESESNCPNEGSALQAIVPTKTLRDHQYEVFFGEAPTSLRELFRRYTFTKQYDFDGPPITRYRNIRLQTSAMAPFYGYDPGASETIGGQPVSICGVSPLTYMMPCFAGWRGSVRRKYLFYGNISRNPQVSRTSAISRSTTIIDLPDNPAGVSRWNTRLFSQHGFSGVHTTDLNNNNCIEVEMPYYNGTRMSTSRMPSQGFSNGVESFRLTFGMPYSEDVVAANNRSSVLQYDSVGEDFTLFFFTGCPILYHYKVEDDF